MSLDNKNKEQEKTVKKRKKKKTRIALKTQLVEKKKKLSTGSTMKQEPYSRLPKRHT